MWAKLYKIIQSSNGTRPRFITNFKKVGGIDKFFGSPKTEKKLWNDQKHQSFEENVFK